MNRLEVIQAKENGAWTRVIKEEVICIYLKEVFWQFADSLDVGVCKRGVKNDPKVFGQEKWGNEFFHYQDEEY